MHLPFFFFLIERNSKRYSTVWECSEIGILMIINFTSCFKIFFPTAQERARDLLNKQVVPHKKVALFKGMKGLWTLVLGCLAFP